MDLAAGDTIQGLAGTAAAVAYSIYGAELPAAGGQNYKTLGQNLMPSSATTLYTVPTVPSTRAVVKKIVLSNTTGSPVTVTLYTNGSSAANQQISLTLAAGVTATGTDKGWQAIDANGQSLVVSITAVPNSRQVIAGAGLTGGGDLTADRTFNVIAGDATIVVNADELHANVGTGAGSVAAGNDGRLSDARTPTAHAATHKGGGTDVIANVTTALAGLMSSADKIKLNGAYVDAVADLGADPTGAVDATTIIQNGLNAMTSGGRLYFPQGTYKITANITVSHPVIICGAGRAISVISTTSATATMFTMIAGAQGAGFEQIRLIGATAGTRTAGYAVDFGAQPNVYMQQCDILFNWSGVHSSGALQFLDDINIREGGANAINGAGVLVDSTGDRYLRRLTMDQGTNPTGYADVRINECSSCVMTDCNLIHGNIALDITATAGAGHAIASVDCVNCFFDTSVVGCRINCATASDTVQRVMFLRCWFSTQTTAGVQIQHANINSVDFVSCEFYQSPFGIDASAATEWAVRASRFAGNTTNAIRTTAGATHSFAITDNVIGNVAGFGANAQGILIQAGTYKRYQILDNRGLETNTTPGLSDLGVVAATDQKVIQNNVGALINGAIATLTAPVTSGAAATETLMMNARIPANAVSVGQAFRFTLWGINSGTGTVTARARVGANGTIADNQVWITAASAANAATSHSFMTGIIIVRSIGAPGSAIGDGQLTNSPAAAGNVTGTGLGAAATGAITTTAPWFIDITVTDSVLNGFVAQGGVIEAL